MSDSIILIKIECHDNLLDDNLFNQSNPFKVMKKNHKMEENKSFLSSRQSKGSLSKSFIVTLLIILLFVPVIRAQKLDLSVKQVPMKEALKLIESKTNYVFFYNDADIDVTRKVTIDVKNTSLDAVLKTILSGVSYRIDSQANKVYLLPAKQVNSAKAKITGVVVDKQKEPIIGVSVILKGSTTGTLTDLDGKFTLDAPEGSTLTFTYVGYISKDVLLKSDKMLNVVLEEDNILMDEVVVVGYGTMKKSDVTGSMSSLKSENFNVGIMSSPTEMMQGRSSGVNITANGGEPGSGMTVRIRGNNSIRSGQDPLYVIDGVPIDITDEQAGGANVGGVGSSAKKNPLNFLSSGDIESMEILKDASATAIYGARGANGVIIITTKKGKTGNAKVNYSNYLSLSMLPKKLPVMSADEYRSFIASNNLGTSVVDKHASTNWQDEIFRTAFSQNHDFSLSGGSESTLYRLSLSYMDQEGVIDRTGMNKYTGRFNVSQDVLNKRIKFESNVTFARTEDKRVPIGSTGGHEGDVLLSALKLNPTFPIYNEDGSFHQTSIDERNPVAMIKLTNDKNTNDRLLANLMTTVNIIKGLSYKINFAIDLTQISRKVTQNKELIYMTDGGTVDMNNREHTSKLMEQFVTYDFNLGENHRFNVLGGFSYQHFRLYSYGFSERGFKQDIDLDYENDLNLGSYNEATVRSGIAVHELQSFYTRVNYNLYNKYAFTATLRADGSTKFGKNNKYGYFPSAAFAWRADEENFIKNMNTFSNLKLRLGWGITGNQEIPGKMSHASIGTASNTGAILDGSKNNVIPGVTLTRTPNPDLKWESTAQYNLGLDFGFFKNRLTASIDLYSKSTKDVLLQVGSIFPAPTTHMWSNIDQMKILNKGIDLEVNGVLIDNKDLTWNAGVNFSTVKNRVKDLPETSITTGYPSGPGITGTPSQVIMNDKPLGTFWGPKFIGFDENGISQYETDKDGKVIDQDLGSALPDFTLNFNTSLKYKRWDLGLFFNGVFGNKVYNNLANVIDQKTLVAKGWNARTEATQTNESFNNTLKFSDRFIEDGSFFRLSSATLGYTFDTKRFDFISRLHVYVAANNLFVISNYTGYDPEVNSNNSSKGVPAIGIDWTTYPKARSFMVGLNVEF